MILYSCRAWNSILDTQYSVSRSNW